MKFLSTLFVALSFSTFASAETKGKEVPLQTLNSVGYYVLTETKTLDVELPYTATLAVTHIGVSEESAYVANLQAQLNSATSFPEVQELLQKYPDYKLNVIAPNSFRSISMDLGNNHIMQMLIAEHGTEFFSGIVKLNKQDGQRLVSRLKSGDFPPLEINVESSQPLLKTVAQERINIPSLCNQLRLASRKRTLGGAISALTLLSAKGTLSVSDEGLRDKIVDIVLRQCYSLDGTIKSSNVGSVLSAPLVSESPKNLVTVVNHSVDYLVVNKPWKYISKVVIQ